MKPQLCAREGELWNAIASGQWPADAGADLTAHVASCEICRDLEIVATSLCTESAAMRDEANPPSSAIVWWRAQMRARHEAAAAVERPIRIAQVVAIPCALGLALGLIGSVAAWVRGSAGWLSDWSISPASVTTAVAALDFTSRWVLVPAVLIAASLVIMPIAVYAIISDE